MGFFARVHRAVSHLVWERGVGSSRPQQPSPTIPLSHKTGQLGPFRKEGRAMDVSGLSYLARSIGIEMICIPREKFIFQGVQGVACGPFKLAKTELTNGQFNALLESQPEELARICTNPQGSLQESLAAAQIASEAENCPMVFLDQNEAAGIAELLGLRLPTELEWERAAAGLNGRAFSFGELPETGLPYRAPVSFGEGTRSVYAHQHAATPEGLLDLSGNVWEWTSSEWGKIDLSDPANPKLPSLGAYSSLPIEQEVIVRGGSHRTFINRMRVICRGHYSPATNRNDVGIRFASNWTQLMDWAEG